MRYLITGANGQLGREFSKALKIKEEEFFTFSREELDIRDFKKIIDVFTQLKPKIVINCSAYNQVDRAEEEFDKALAVNSTGVANLALACRIIGALLIHYSTDYVFDGENKGLYTEEVLPNPINKYGLSKYLGEKQIESILDDYLIFRTSWVYGDGTQNFHYKLNQWVSNLGYLRVAADEFSVPTSTKTIVEITLKAVKKGLLGLFHLVNSGCASRYEWAKEYLSLQRINKFIYPAKQADFNLRAKRPYFSAMSNESISCALNITIPEWKEELKNFLGGVR